VRHAQGRSGSKILAGQTDIFRPLFNMSPMYIDIIHFFFGMRLYNCLCPINVHKTLISDHSSYMSSYIVFSFTVNYCNIIGPYTNILINNEHIFIFFLVNYVFATNLSEFFN